MKNVILVLLAAVIIMTSLTIIKSCQRRSASKNSLSGSGQIRLKSSAFGQNKTIPSLYSCLGGSINPPLAWDSIPANAKSLALIVDDPDAPAGTFTHWLVWNIDPATNFIKENSWPPEATIGKNSAGQDSYAGPCPPAGLHHYRFMLFALDIKLQLPATSGANELQSAMKAHIIDQAMLVGLFRK